MKLYFENENTSSISIKETLNESGETKKHYIIKGIFSSPGQKNKNGRIYPLNLWEREVEKYQEVLKNGSPNSLMELEHPPRQNVDMMEAVGKMKRLWIENNYVMGEAVLLDNPKANQLKTLIDNGIKMSVSSRSIGKCTNGIVEDFHLITFDIIPNLNQSDINAEMMGIVEGCLKDKEFMIVGESIVEIKDSDKFKDEIKAEIKAELGDKSQSSQNSDKSQVNKVEPNGESDTLKADVVKEVEIDKNDNKVEIKTTDLSNLDNNDLKDLQDKIKVKFADILADFINI